MYSIANSFIAKYTCMDFYMKTECEVKINSAENELVTVGNTRTGVTNVTTSSYYP
jgi:hypothetical protein